MYLHMFAYHVNYNKKSTTLCRFATFYLHTRYTNVYTLLGRHPNGARDRRRRHTVERKVIDGDTAVVLSGLVMMFPSTTTDVRIARSE